MKRAAAYGDGWCGFNLTAADTAERIERLRELLKANNRKPEEFEFSVSPLASGRPEELKDYSDAGVDELYLTTVFQRQMATEAEVTGTLEELARLWIKPAK